MIQFQENGEKEVEEKEVKQENETGESSEVPATGTEVEGAE